jgi:hypothetical protein
MGFEERTHFEVDKVCIRRNFISYGNHFVMVTGQKVTGAGRYRLVKEFDRTFKWNDLGSRRL